MEESVGRTLDIWHIDQLERIMTKLQSFGDRGDLAPIPYKANMILHCLDPNQTDFIRGTM